MLDALETSQFVLLYRQFLLSILKEIDTFPRFYLVLLVVLIMIILIMIVNVLIKILKKQHQKRLLQKQILEVLKNHKS